MLLDFLIYFNAAALVSLVYALFEYRELKKEMEKRKKF